MIVWVLHDAFSRAGIASARLWAAVPHYLAITPNPKAALALVERAVRLVGASVDVDALERASQVYEQKVSEVVATDEDVQAYVRILEERMDDQEDEHEPLDEREIPSGDAIAAELERFLEQRRPDDP